VEHDETKTEGSQNESHDPRLIKRINRKLAHEGEQLRTARGADNASVGYYFIADRRSRWVVASHIDMEQLGHELGVLKKYEEIVE